MPETARHPTIVSGTLEAEPLDAFLAELAGAATFPEASRRLTDALARMTGASQVAFYTLG
jgi:hypothetical protein